MTGATGETRAAFEAKGAEDWENFLMMRARDLAPGGFLALFNFGIDAAGRYLGNTGEVSMFDAFEALWRELVADGTITEAEYRATNFPQVYHTMQPFRAPLDDPDSPVHKAGPRAEHVETRAVRCPFAQDFEGHGVATAFARAPIPTKRSCSEPVFLAGLSADRPAQERAAIVDDFYGRYEAQVAAAPERHGMDCVHCYMICRKI